MKAKHLFISIVVLLSFTGCTNWLTAEQPDVTMLEDYYTSAAAATQNVTACYVPLQWEFGDVFFGVVYW